MNINSARPSSNVILFRPLADSGGGVLVYTSFIEAPGRNGVRNDFVPSTEALLGLIPEQVLPISPILFGDAAQASFDAPRLVHDHIVSHTRVRES